MCGNQRINCRLLVVSFYHVALGIQFVLSGLESRTFTYGAILPSCLHLFYKPDSTCVTPFLIFSRCIHSFVLLGIANVSFLGFLFLFSKDLDENRTK